MTREEAIKRFETLLLHVDTDCVMGMETTEAINMAIKALKQSKPCEDAVSRKAAIDAIISFFKLTDYNESAYAVRTVLGDLSPVTPKQHTGKWIPADSQCGIRCSVCGVPVDDFCHSIDYIDLDYEPNFCPNCGLKMEGVNNDT